METKRDETNLKTFNTAKKFAEEVLFPLMFDFKKFQRQANFGNQDLNEAIEINEEIREIQRFNGLKAMVETCHDLLQAISSTVMLKGNEKEQKKLEETLELTNKVKTLFYENKSKFFRSVFKEHRSQEIIDREYFEKVKNIIDVCYINTEILMTKNKLLFADAQDEYLSDEEIKEQIKREYIEN